ncbi:MAG: DUF2019 domain-containing protein [Bradyrhizobiaceae bacterium]|nr:MAG: DUF2019 domain-containing protein [Bradyrhizobiaceae bacterium]
MNDSLSTLNVQQLIERFVELSLQEDRAVNAADISEINAVVSKIYEIGKELETRDGDQRLVLARLLQSQNLRVRFNAAKALFSLMPTEARRQIEAIAASKRYPIAGNAGTFLFLRDESFKNGN